MQIGYRTLKTAIAAPAAVWIAELMQLDSYGSAGIIAVLCIQPTRKQSFLTAWHRIAAGLLSMVYAYVIFEWIGYSPLTIGLLLLLFIPVTDKLNITPGIVTSLVILFHFYAARRVDIDIIINEALIMFIGIGVALILNLYMPNLDNKFADLRIQVESNYQSFFRNVAKYLRGEVVTINGEMLIATKKALKEADILVQRDLENTFSKSTSYRRSYFSMREIQLHSLERMLKVIRPQMVSVKQAKLIADLLDDLADAIYPENPVDYHIHSVNDLLDRFEKQDLPKTREEFEIRADLFQLLNEIDHYLTIKNQTVKDILD
ncbi:hypothetical protein GCM10012290_10700 [Halolactibacillus alkaliphilus]|uniref:Putative aromatic acid exporter C-terminal domain-containing protein n=1 Tax=Halolactibacillus alkaliphilus TaxID=442899 RepID=A0A511X2R5_9BACI|nr:aromatic acid exporter family protein [Halolactibacillus alkaliphilus]GEN57215.1 hypothetical protein HAL01_16790 [Halolactibacillus alkaliphilus]GGN68725.1 hypothetical protein GCM10012290_10700 [Halolactibacillus alkaliphilus]SFO72874.1 Uncharacterized membrane protein YgaE, UPF0421/DUF939 family [Halolactibacillus alkaliphilus]